MIRIQNQFGTVEVSDSYLAGLLSEIVSNSFGVVGMATSSASQGLRAFLFGENLPDRGVKVRSEDGKLIIDLHIIVTYGVNIRAIVKSIIHNASYTVERTTGLIVHRVNVFVDGLVA